MAVGRKTFSIHDHPAFTAAKQATDDIPSVNFVLSSSCWQNWEALAVYQVCCLAKVIGLECVGVCCGQGCWLEEVDPCKEAMCAVGGRLDQVDPDTEEPLFYPDNHKAMQCHHYCHGDWASPGVWPLHLIIGTEKASGFHQWLGLQTVPEYNEGTENK
jgi:hypothetical protein